MENIFKKLNEDLKSAMKSGDKDRLETIRMMKSKILNVNARGELPEAEIIKILMKYAKSLKQSIEEYKKVNKGEEIEKIGKEVNIVEEYLPEQMSEEKLQEVVKKAIEEVGASTKKDMGKVMKKVMAENAGVDGSAVNKIASQILK